MNRIKIRDKCILLTVLLCLLAYAGYNYILLPVNSQTHSKTQQAAELKDKVQDGRPLKNQIKQLQSDDAKLTEIIEQNKHITGNKSLNKEDFLTFLTNECTRGNAELIKFSDLGINESGDKWKAQFDFELRGTLEALNNVCQAIDKIGISYSVGGFSLRQNNKNDYLSRYFDNNTKLEWYRYDEPELEELTNQEDSSYLEIAPEMPPIPAYPEKEHPEILPPAEPIEPMPQPSPEPKDETISDRLDSLLNQINTSYVPYNIMFLIDQIGFQPKLVTIDSEEVMLLNITIEFTMYANPKDFQSSFLLATEAEV